jgi:formamidopyrimidine-DNA glycosylase
MPELPDVVVYVERLASRIVGQRLEHVRLLNPFCCAPQNRRSLAAEGLCVVAAAIGKRIVVALEGELFLVLHSMIAGRLRWLERGAKPPGRITLAVLEFSLGSLAFTEAGTKRRVRAARRTAKALRAFDRRPRDHGRRPWAFRERLQRENHTLKRARPTRNCSAASAMPIPTILHRARVTDCADAEIDVVRRSGCMQRRARYSRNGRRGCATKPARNFRATSPLSGRRWRCTARVPANLVRTAAHRCSASPTPRTRPTTARCQTDGKVLADRAMSRLLKSSWPRSIDRARLKHARARRALTITVPQYRWRSP